MSLRKFANLFVDIGEAPAPKPEPAIEQKSKKQTTATQVSTPAAATPAPLIIPGQVDDEILKILEEAINEANIPGFDYLEFRDVLANMASINMPEPQKFQAAFASAQVAKITKPQLLEAVDFYLKVIEAKETEFNIFVAGQRAADIDGKDNVIADLDKEIEESAAQIQKLTELISEKRRKQDSIRMEKAQAELDLRNKESAFAATKSVVVGKLISDRNKIDSYIQ